MLPDYLINFSRIKVPAFSKMVVKAFVITILCTLVIVEFLPIPYAEFYAPTPQFYQVLANDHSNFSVIEVPIQNPVQSLYLYYQSAYSAPLIDGSIPRSPQYPSMIIQTAPFIDQLGYYTPGKAPASDIVNQTYPITTLAPYIMAQYNVKYIIVHKDLFNSPTAYLAYVDQLTPLLGQPIYQDSAIVAFRFVPPSPNTGIVQFLRQYNNISLVSLLYGNWLRFGVFGPHVRAMSGFAGLNVFSATDRMIQTAIQSGRCWTGLSAAASGKRSGTRYLHGFPGRVQCLFYGLLPHQRGRKPDFLFLTNRM